MDIDLLSKMVKELILDEDRVTLPGLGSFVAEIVPAAFSDKGYTINPPYRRLFFRSRPDQGEELVNFYASSNKLEKEVAEKIIKDFLSELKDVLHDKKTVVFPGLGRLRATKENNLFFVADEDLDIYPDGFGLEPISLKTHHETPAQVAAAVVGLKSMMTEPFPSGTPEPQIVSESPALWEAEVLSEPEIVSESALPLETEVLAQPQIVSEPEVRKESSQEHQDATPEPEGHQQPSKPQQEARPESEVTPEQIQHQPEALSEPEVQPDTLTEVSGSAPVIEIITVPVVEPEPEPVAELENVSVPEPAVPVASSPQFHEDKPKPASRIFKAIIWTVAAAAVLIIAFTAVARMNPGIMDSILYTPEELEIVKTL